MPYIKQDERDTIELELSALNPEGWTAGQLGFALFRILDRWCVWQKPANRSFATFAGASGVVTETLAEWRRRRIVPYEQKKMKENGDVV